MGGATENNQAMKWFLQQAAGGDVLVLRASGADGYNDYLYADLGVTVNSVETIVCKNAAASNEPYIHQKISQAEAIWFAGGDQWKYVSYWRNTPVDSLVNQAIRDRNIVVGGTSAGMAIQGKYYFSAQNGTVTSENALANPYTLEVTVDSGAFIRHDQLTDVITDTHFDSPDRRGRMAVFLSRIYSDYGAQGKGIACDEYTAVCIPPDGIARIFGDYPGNDDNAYFIQTNCELSNPAPESCSPGIPLTWDLGGQALRVYRVKGTNTGANTFNLNDWKTGSGGNWMRWNVKNGNFLQQNSVAPNCISNTDHAPGRDITFSLYPNPTSGAVHVLIRQDDGDTYACQVYNILGQPLPVTVRNVTANTLEVDVSHLQKGLYFLELSNDTHQKTTQILVHH
jgi:cyanophycinase-like exopeptidase